MECNAQPGNIPPSHATTMVRAPNYMNCFAFCFELPILWKDILTRYERLLLERYLCPAGLELVLTRHCCLSEPQQWRLHCHCEDKLSLQCLASTQVLKAIVLKLIAGCKINRNHFWYRELLNCDRPDEVVYMGSVMYKFHFVYFAINISCMDAAPRALQLIRQHLNPEMGELVRGKFNYWLIMKCKSCSGRDMVALKCCANRMRRFTKRILEEMAREPIWLYVRFNTSGAEERRQRALRRAMVYNRCCHSRDLSLVNLNAFLHF